VFAFRPLLQVDATIHDKSAETHEVQGYPTLKWFVKGEAEEYSGGRSASEIVAWVNKKSGPAAAPIPDVAAAQTASQGMEVFVLGVFASESSAEAKAFIEAAKGSSSLSFGISTNPAVASHYGVSVPGVSPPPHHSHPPPRPRTRSTGGLGSALQVVIIKSFDDGNAKYEGEMTSEAIARFANAESLPLVVEFNDENAPKIFGGEIKSHLLLFADAKDEAFPGLKAALTKASRTFKGKLLFITIDGSQGDNGR
jgi:protein disulfide-isomerase A1